MCYLIACTADDTQRIEFEPRATARPYSGDFASWPNSYLAKEAGSGWSSVAPR